jgi:hypothetical protein
MPDSTILPAPDLDRFDATFVRRQKALARTGPLHELEASKAMRDGDWSAYDLRALALAALDRVMEHMGLEYGATHDQIVGELAPLASAANPAADAGERSRVATTVLAALLNDRNRREAFQSGYSDFSGAEGHARRVLSFRLLQEVEAPDGSVVLRATDEAINLFYSALDHDIEDAQSAAEAVLRSQMSRGLLDRAVATAREARFRSLQFGEKIERALRAARRDLRQVDWGGDVSPMLDAAVSHLKERMTVERELLRSARGQLERAEPTQLSAAAELVELVEDCRTRHVQLQKQILEARPTFMAEQERQVFAPRAAAPLPELERELLMPLLVASRAEAAPVLKAFSRAAAGPCVQRQVRLCGLVDLLLQPRRERYDGAAEWAEPELVQCDAELRCFNPAEEAVIETLLEGLDEPRRLSHLLEAARDACGPEGDDPEARPDAAAEMMRLVALFAFSPEAPEASHGPTGLAGEPGVASPGSLESEPGHAMESLQSLHSVDDATPLDDLGFGGSDLLLSLEPRSLAAGKSASHSLIGAAAEVGAQGEHRVGQ